MFACGQHAGHMIAPVARHPDGACTGTSVKSAAHPTSACALQAPHSPAASLLSALPHQAGWHLPLPASAPKQSVELFTRPADTRSGMGMSWPIRDCPSWNDLFLTRGPLHGDAAETPYVATTR